MRISRIRQRKAGTKWQRRPNPSLRHCVPSKSTEFRPMFALERSKYDIIKNPQQLKDP